MTDALPNSTKLTQLDLRRRGAVVPVNPDVSVWTDTYLSFTRVQRDRLGHCRTSELLECRPQLPREIFWTGPVARTVVDEE